MIHIGHVRSGNERALNGFATVLNWTSKRKRLSISVGSFPVRAFYKKTGVSMKSVTAIRFGLAAALLLFIALVTPQPSHGQQVMAAITGKVTDPSGAGVPEAKVTVSDVDRGTVFTSVTNAGGTYDLPQVPIGTYNVRVEYP